MCGRRKARLAEHFEVQSNVRILYTRYFVPVRCTENENFLKNLKKFRAAPMFGQISGRIFAVIPRAPCRRCAPPLPETVRRALLIHVSAGSVGFADARRPPPAPLSSLPPLCPSSARRRYSFPERKKRSGDFSEPLFIFGLPLPADSESRKVKKEPHRAV